MLLGKSCGGANGGQQSKRVENAPARWSNTLEDAAAPCKSETPTVDEASSISMRWASDEHELLNKSRLYISVELNDYYLEAPLMTELARELASLSDEREAEAAEI